MVRLWTYILTTIEVTSNMMWSVRVVRPILAVLWWCGDGQTERNRDVELLPCGKAYMWILGDLHTLARH